MRPATRADRVVRNGPEWHGKEAYSNKMMDAQVKLQEKKITAKQINIEHIAQ